MASQPSGPFCAPAAAPVRRASLSSGRSSYPTFPDPTAHAAPPIASSSTPTLDAAFCYLPPGLGLNVKGASAVYLDRDDFVEDLSDGRGELSLPHLTSTSEPSRRGGGSSSSSSEESGSGGVEDSAMSPTSSLASSTIEEPKHPVGGLGGRTKWAAGLEDPGLEAARRALWEDPDEPTSAAGSEGEEGGDSVDADNESEEEDDTDEDTGDEEFWVLRLPPVPTPSSPAHATLNPLPSCLRPPLPSRSASGSSSSSAPSVQFATQRTFTLTYSPSDYERRGEGPVEKLSVKEWCELKSVREAVGLFSGKIAPWQDGQAPPSSDDDSGSNSSTPTGALSRNGSTTTDGDTRKSCGQLAATTGILSVGVLSSGGGGSPRRPPSW